MEAKMMNLWAELEERIKRHGVRVEERLALLSQLKSDHDTGGTSVASHRESLLRKVNDAATRVEEILRS